MAVVRVQINIPKLKTPSRDIIDFIMGELDELDYNPSLKSYKYQKGKQPGTISQVQFIIFAQKYIDDYVEFTITIEFTTDRGAVDKGVLSGESKLVFLAEMNLDYDKRWSSNKYLSFLKNIFEKHIYNKKLDDLGDKLEDETFDVINAVKSKLNVK